MYEIVDKRKSFFSCDYCHFGDRDAGCVVPKLKERETEAVRERERKKQSKNEI